MLLLLSLFILPKKPFRYLQLLNPTNNLVDLNLQTKMTRGI